MLQNGKAIIEEGLGALRITVPARKNWFVLGFATFWLFGWAFGLVMVSGILMSPREDTSPVVPFVSVWLLMWIMGGLAVLSLLLWGYFGKEIFEVDKGEVHFEKTAFGIGWKKTLMASEIHHFRFESVNTAAMGGNKWAAWGIGPGKVKFDYGLQTYSFALGVDDAEALYLIEKLKSYFKQ